MKTAVVILNWNGRELLERFLPGVVRFSAGPRRAVVVADNGSTDDSVAWIRTNHPEVRIVALDRNYGFAEGYNRALAQVGAEYFVLLNSDVEVTGGWLDPLEALLERDAAAAAVMPKIRSARERERFEYAGACGGFIDRLGYPFCRGRVLQAVEKDEGQYDDRRPVFWATGACMMVRSDCFAAAGGLSASFFAHQEEIDLCWRLQLAGRTIWVEPASVVYHLGGGTLSVDDPRKTYLNYRNNLSMLYRNLPRGRMQRILAVRILLDALSAWVFLLQGKPKLFAAVWRAHRDFIRRRKADRPIRAALQRGSPAAVSGIYRGSIVWRYFTGRKISPIV
jgi:GT2 family glycosyltransferase